MIHEIYTNSKLNTFSDTKIIDNIPWSVSSVAVVDDIYDIKELFMHQASEFSDEELLDGRTLSVFFVTKKLLINFEPEFGKLEPNAFIIHTDNFLQKKVDEGMDIDQALNLMLPKEL